MQSVPGTGEILGGKYRVLGVLGRGGMGAVLEVEHHLTQKRFAVKWMHPQLASDANAQTRFVREAQASARVRHPNIVEIYDVVRDGSAIFLVMELLEGETLTALLRRGEEPIHRLIALLLPALRAVAAAHRQGVIHRDLKPENIFLSRSPDSPDLVPKVLDFGISKLSDHTGLSLTRPGAAIGTPMYMSLEQLCGDRDLDARADIYAIGVILYELVTGRPPFEAETFSELAIKVATTQPPGPRQLRPGLPAPLAKLISAAMARHREQRTASVDELIRDLEPFASADAFPANLAPVNVPARASGAPGTPPGSVPRPISGPVRGIEASQTWSSKHGRKPHTWLAVLAACLTVALGLGLWMAMRPGTKPAQPGQPRASAPTLPSPVAAPAPSAAPAALGAPLPEPAAAPGVDTPVAPIEAPSEAPLAPKAQHAASDAWPAPTREHHVRPSRTRTSVVKRAGPARRSDF